MRHLKVRVSLLALLIITTVVAGLYTTVASVTNSHHSIQSLHQNPSATKSLSNTKYDPVLAEGYLLKASSVTSAPVSTGKAVAKDSTSKWKDLKKSVKALFRKVERHLPWHHDKKSE